MADPENIPEDVMAATDPVAPPADTPPMPRFNPGELLSAACALLLLGAMFALEWYGVDGRPGVNAAGSGLSSAENAWNGLHLLRWVMLLTIGLACLSPLLHWGQRAHGAKTSTGGLVTALGCLTAASLLVRVLIDLPSAGPVVDQKVGALFGLLSAIGIAFGGWETMRAERTHERRFGGGLERRQGRLSSRRAVR